MSAAEPSGRSVHPDGGERPAAATLDPSNGVSDAEVEAYERAQYEATNGLMPEPDDPAIVRDGIRAGLAAAYAIRDRHTAARALREAGRDAIKTLNALIRRADELERTQEADHG